MRQPTRPARPSTRQRDRHAGEACELREVVTDGRRLAAWGRRRPAAWSHRRSMRRRRPAAGSRRRPPARVAHSSPTLEASATRQRRRLATHALQRPGGSPSRRSASPALASTTTALRRSASDCLSSSCHTSPERRSAATSVAARNATLRLRRRATRSRDRPARPSRRPGRTTPDACSGKPLSSRACGRVDRLRRRRAAEPSSLSTACIRVASLLVSRRSTPSSCPSTMPAEIHGRSKRSVSSAAARLKRACVPSCALTMPWKRPARLPDVSRRRRLLPIDARGSSHPCRASAHAVAQPASPAPTITACRRSRAAGMPRAGAWRGDEARLEGRHRHLALAVETGHALDAKARCREPVTHFARDAPRRRRRARRGQPADGL